VATDSPGVRKSPVRSRPCSTASLRHTLHPPKK
jgi:hypothetical protein